MRENIAWRVKPHQGIGDEKRYRMRRQTRKRHMCLVTRRVCQQ